MTKRPSRKTLDLLPSHSPHLLFRTVPIQCVAGYTEVCHMVGSSPSACIVSCFLEKFGGYRHKLEETWAYQYPALLVETHLKLLSRSGH